MSTIHIDPEFRGLIPPLTTEEREQLEANIVADGCRDPLVLWHSKEHGSILLDGHNRYEICEARGLPYDTTHVILPDRDAAKVWVIKNQFGRRNIPPFVRAELALKLEPLIAARAKASYDANVGRRGKSSQKSATIEKVDTRAELAKVAGVSHDTIHKAKVVAEKASEEVKEKLRRGDTSINAAYTDIKRKEKEERRQEVRAKNRALVETTPPPAEAVQPEPFQAIVLDPPWDWGDEGDVDQLGRARPTYATMPVDEIAALPVGRFAEKNAHLYLWITNRSLPKGFALLDAWGFRYVTTLTWVKPSFGMGNYFRGSTEQVLFAVRGSLPLLRNDVGTHFSAPRPGEHSGKPGEFYQLVESCSPGPWLEMFGRRQRPGWVVWGAEALKRAG